MPTPTPTPIAICIEDLDAASPDQRFLQCVALTGRQPGLRLDAEGHVTWHAATDDAATAGAATDGAALELWVSLDQRLILFRPADAPPSVVRREGRSLDVPFERPVVLIDQDRIEIGGRRLRVHLHGETSTIRAPAYLVPASSRGARAARAAATALALGATLGASGCPKQVEVRDQPPSPPPVEPRDAGVVKPDRSPPKPDLTPIKPDQRIVKKRPKPPVEVRVRPPEPPVEPPPPPPKKPRRPKKPNKP